MLKFALRRTAQALLVFVIVTFLCYVALYQLGNPFASLGENRVLPPETQAILREKFKLDQPLLAQYLNYLGNLFTGDLGIDYDKRLPVVEMIAHTVPNTMRLAVLAVALQLVIGICAGVLAAVRQGSFTDALISVSAITLMSVPLIVTAAALRDTFNGTRVLGITLFPQLPRTIAVEVHWYDELLLPAFALALGGTAFIARMTRTTMLEVLESDYVRTARAKGLRPRTVLYKHALRNAVIPIANIAAIELGVLLGGAIIVETIFQYDGVGYLFARSLRALNAPLLMAIMSYMVVAFVVLIALLDILCAYLDPRLRID
ncbi:MAG TPA: ABC transporter permease [Actinophytocola sp.]|jgi:ABC-type dipeptide/oligopeptide/nickel transport system permease component|uniref:ABC transporter permease n=1 Tax=Actinophytocola sp. TaxID=1872138 RepID=UPI002F922E5C